MDILALERMAENATRSLLVAAEAKGAPPADGGNGAGGAGREMRKAQHQIPSDDSGNDDAGDDADHVDIMALEKSQIPEDIRKEVETLQDLGDKALLLAALVSTPEQRVRPEDTDFYKREIRPRLKKASAGMRKQMDTATSGEGSQWVPSGYSSRLFELIQNKLVVGNLFEQIQMPRSPWIYPTTTARPTMYLGSEQTGDESTKTYTATNPTTGSFTLTAKKIGGRVPFSEELEEDAVVPLLDSIRKNLAYHLARALEDAILNGDTATPHMDNDITAATDHRKAWIGLRAQAIDLSSTVSLATFSTANLRKLIASMGAYCADDPVANLAIIVGPKTSMRQLNELGSALRTPEQYGGGGIIIERGEVARFDGIPVIRSIVARENLNTVGVRDSTTQDNGTVLVVYKPAWVLGIRRGPRMRTWLSTLFDQQHLIADWRGAFATPWTTTEKHVALGTDVDVS